MCKLHIIYYNKTHFILFYFFIAEVQWTGHRWMIHPIECGDHSLWEYPICCMYCGTEEKIKRWKEKEINAREKQATNALIHRTKHNQLKINFTTVSYGSGILHRSSCPKNPILYNYFAVAVPRQRFFIFYVRFFLILQFLS